MTLKEASKWQGDVQRGDKDRCEMDKQIGIVEEQGTRIEITDHSSACVFGGGEEEREDKVKTYKDTESKNKKCDATQLN